MGQGVLAGDVRSYISWSRKNLGKGNGDIVICRDQVLDLH